MIKVIDPYSGTRLNLYDDYQPKIVYGISFVLNRVITGDVAWVDVTAWGITQTVIIYQDGWKTLTNPDNPNDKITWYTHGVGSGGASIYVQPYSPLTEPSLVIDAVVVELSPTGDVPKYNRYGVYLEVHLSGTGTGSLKISWGNDLLETKIGIVAGNYAYVYNLPTGTHNICADLFSIE